MPAITKGRNAMGVGEHRSSCPRSLCVGRSSRCRFLLHFRAERRKRELDHIERMRAIEVGRSYPGELRNRLAGLPAMGRASLDRGLDRGRRPSRSVLSSPFSPP